MTYHKIAIRLGPRQKSFLLLVCNTIGGVKYTREGLEAKRVQRLFDLGFIQSKDSAPWLVVATPAGLEYVRQHYGLRRSLR